jgi:hypothetical protein
MRFRNSFKHIASLLALPTLARSCLALAQTSKPDDSTGQWKAVESAMGRSGKLRPDGAFKFSMPRKNLKVTVNRTPVQAGLALGSWLAFVGALNYAMVTGDLVLTEDEVGSVMMKLQQDGIQEAAVHNHLLRETPRVMYMHIEGHGDAVNMAKSIYDALVLTKTPAAESSPAPAPTGEQEIDIDTSQINSILGDNGKVNGGILQISVPRAQKIMDEGMEVPPSMGTSTALNFQPTGNGRAAITGVFVLLPDEVNPVLKALRDNGIQVTALHSHMLNDQPHLHFMHFWANDDATKLTRGLRAALDKTDSAGGEREAKEALAI